MALDPPNNFATGFLTPDEPEACEQLNSLRRQASDAEALASELQAVAFDLRFESPYDRGTTEAQFRATEAHLHAADLRRNVTELQAAC